MNWDLFYSVLSGLAICVPLVVKLGIVIRNLVQEKNWSGIVAFALDYMAEAETLFESGAERKEYVMQMVESSAKLVNYNFDNEAKEKVSEMIDAICDASRVINSEVIIGGDFE